VSKNREYIANQHFLRAKSELDTVQTNAESLKNPPIS